MIGSAFRIGKTLTIFSWSSLVNSLKVMYYLFLLFGIFFLPFFSFLFIGLFFIITHFVFVLWWTLRTTADVGITVAKKTLDVGGDLAEDLAEGMEKTGDFLIKAQEQIKDRVKETIESEKIRAKKIVKDGAGFIDSKL